MNTNASPVFSVIIPCYNSAAWIKQGLQSLEGQTFSAFEVLLIDDCSGDTTYTDLITYKMQSPLDIQLFRNEKNCGPGETRNQGICWARGEYLTFMDSDDWYEADYLEQMYEKISQTEADIVFCDFFRCTGQGKKQWIKCTGSFSVRSGKADFIAKGFDSLCTMCIKRKLFRSLSIPILYNAEDGAVIPVLTALASNIAFIPHPLYNYRYRKNSLSSSQNARMVHSFCEAADFLVAHTSEEYKEEFEYREIQIRLYSIVLKGIAADMDLKVIHKMVADFSTRKPMWFKNKYLSGLPMRKRIFLKCVRYGFYLPLRMYVRLHHYLLS